MKKKKLNDVSEHVVPEDEVAIKSFKAYESSNDDKTKIINGEKIIEDFHVYESGDDDDDDIHDDDDDEE